MYRFLRFPGWKYKAVTLSYDDGLIYDKKLVEILDKYSLKGTFNLCSELLSQGKFLKKDEATKLYGNSKHEVAIHGAKHLSLSTVSSEVAIRDVIVDRENLESQFGTIIKGLAYANGLYDDNAIDLVEKCGIKYARTADSTNKFDLPTDWFRWTPTCHHNAKNLMELVDEFLSATEIEYFWANSPKLFYLWGHSFEFNNDNNWEVIEEFAKKVANREDVWYCTNVELYDYVKAFERLEFSVDGKIIANHSDKDLYLSYYGQKVLVKACGVTKINE